MSPEQLSGDTVSKMTDVYMWALLILYAASGMNPFSADDSRTSLLRIRNEIPVVSRILHEPLASVVTSALAKNPLERPTFSNIMLAIGSERMGGG
jgi:serine/threonine protein kinase